MPNLSFSHANMMLYRAFIPTVNSNPKAYNRRFRKEVSNPRLHGFPKKFSQANLIGFMLVKRRKKYEYHGREKTSEYAFERAKTNMDGGVNSVSLARRIYRISQRPEYSDPEPYPEFKGPSPLEVFGVELSVLRRRKGFSLEDLADRAGMDPDLLLAIEVGSARPSLIAETLPALASALGVSVRTLVNRLVELAIG